MAKKLTKIEKIIMSKAVNIMIEKESYVPTYMNKLIGRQATNQSRTKDEYEFVLVSKNKE